MKTNTSRWLLASGCALAVLTAPLAHAATLSGQLGILDLTANGGINPNTGEPWKAGDKYHLVYVTTAMTDATSADIAVYNAFVNTDADTQNVTNRNGEIVNLGSVNWFALGSTGTVNAIDNAVITGSAWDVYHSLNPGNSFTGNGLLASNATDFWDFRFPPATGNNSGNPLSDLTGANNNVWTGTGSGGVAYNALGAGTSSRRHWTGWWNWDQSVAATSNTTLYKMAAISQELTVIPEPSSALLVGLGSLALLRRRR